ncbi:MAG TPA: DNA repair protein RecO [Bacteroidales bacterium]|nr:DNA repair protein RecO [Bacteroidales bacterium]
MIVKTKAILLHSLRYSDNSNIVHFYTRDFGKVSMIIKGISAKKKTTRNIYLQPFYIFNLEFYMRETREMQTLKELSLLYTPVEMPVNVFKSTIALFLSEVAHSVIREEEVNYPLYDFLESSIISLDSITENVENFHLWFLVRFAALAGIGPTPSASEEEWFDLMNGVFVLERPLHDFIIEPPLAVKFNSFLISDLSEIGLIKFRGNERSILLELLIKYYSLHFPGMRKIHSLGILNDVFRK